MRFFSVFSLRQLSLKHSGNQSTHRSSSRGHNIFLRLPIAVRLGLGFSLASILAAMITWVIGIQHTELLSTQSNFYQTLLRTNTNLTTGSELLKSMDSQLKKLVDDVTTTHADTDTLTLDIQGEYLLANRYQFILVTYASQDLLIYHADQASLLIDASKQIEQQSIYTDGAQRTWQTYHNIQNHLLSDIASGKTASANDLMHLRVEPSYADAFSALRSLIQFNEQLANSIDGAVNAETEQQITTTILGSFLAFLGVGVVGFLLSRSLVRQLKPLHQVSQAVQRGKMEARVPIIGSDEIADVSISVNTMLEALMDAMQHTIKAKTQIDKAYQQQRQLNEMKDQFIRNVSHELRTPLTQVYGFLQLLREYGDQLETEQQAHFLERASAGCEELIAMFTSILDVSDQRKALQTPHIENLQLLPIVESVIEQCAPDEKESHPISLAIPTSLSIQADAQYLRQVLRNLLSNAFKYTPHYTPIMIQAEQTHNVAENNQSQACISIKDTGPGIPVEEQKFLFQQFVRLKRDLSGNVRGTGLGLYLCRQLIEAMHGRIWVESSGIEGEGSSFIFTLPASTISLQPYVQVARERGLPVPAPEAGC